MVNTSLVSAHSMLNGLVCGKVNGVCGTWKFLAIAGYESMCDM